MKAVEVELVAGTKENVFYLSKLINYNSQPRVITGSTDRKLNENQADMLQLFLHVGWNGTGTHCHKTEMYLKREKYGVLIILYVLFDRILKI